MVVICSLYVIGLSQAALLDMDIDMDTDTAIGSLFYTLLS